MTILNIINSTLEIKKRRTNSYFPYSTIVANGNYQFYLGNSDGNQVVYYYPIKPTYNDIDRIFSIEGKPKTVLSSFVDSEILVNNVPFIRRFENFFTPKYLNEKDIIDFFNFIASRYESLIDKTLNTELIRMVFEKIQRSYIFGEVKRKERPIFNQRTLFEDTEIRLISKNWEEDKMPGKLKVLDYGMGTGLSYEVYCRKKTTTRSRIELFGCDISEKMLEICKLKKLHNITLTKYAHTYYPNNYFDVIFAIFVTHYFLDERPFEEICRILKHGGIFIFNIRPIATSPNGQFFSRKRGYIPTDPSYEDCLLRSGFNNIKHRIWPIRLTNGEKLIPIYIAKWKN